MALSPIILAVSVSIRAILFISVLSGISVAKFPSSMFIRLAYLDEKKSLDEKNDANIRITIMPAIAIIPYLVILFTSFTPSTIITFSFFLKLRKHTIRRITVTISH